MQSSTDDLGNQSQINCSSFTHRKEEAMDVSASSGSSVLNSRSRPAELDSTKTSSHLSIRDDVSKDGSSEKSSSSVSLNVSSLKTSTLTMSSTVNFPKTSASTSSSIVEAPKPSTSVMSSMVDAPKRSTSTMYSVDDFPKMSSSKSGSNVDVSSVESMFKSLDINVTSASDEICPDPDDCTVLENKGEVALIITDYINESVRAIYKHKGNIHTSTRKLKHRPHSVTRLTDTKIAVCYWMHNEITVLKVSEEIEHDKTVATKKDYNCVAPLGKGNLVAGSSEESCVDIINMSGKVIKTFDGFKRPYYNIIYKPRSMCITKAGNIVVTDGGSKMVYCLTQLGEFVFHYLPEDEDRQLHWPRGVAVTEQKYILFADCYTNKIVQISELGVFIRDVLTSRDGISHPHGLCIHGHDLYVTQEENSIVKKFDISGVEFETVLETSKM